MLLAHSFRSMDSIELSKYTCRVTYLDFFFGEPLLYLQYFFVGFHMIIIIIIIGPSGPAVRTVYNTIRMPYNYVEGNIMG